MSAELLLRVMRVLQEADSYDELFYRFNLDGEWTVGIQCSDFFWWGTADMEHVTYENVEVLERAVADCKEVGEEIWGPQLFCARVRKMRPQGAAYPPSPVNVLFDACGPVREVELGNPKRQPIGSS